jgi:starch synthase (maltosyl-transferring)
MQPLPSDRWRAAFVVEGIGRHEFTVDAWIDRFASWRGDLEKKHAAHQDVGVELLEGAALVRETAGSAPPESAGWLHAQAEHLASDAPLRERIERALAPALAASMRAHAPRRGMATHPTPLGVDVERPRAGFGAWYEFFPRSTALEAGAHGRLRDCGRMLRYVADMGFDVVYLPPVHPIGRVHRKGRNNQPTAQPGDPGSPWAIGSDQGGHTDVHPELGDLEAFEGLVADARSLGLEVAIDLAFQCAPDHPWVTKHPEWFRRRPDGSIQYAENPPKKYQDIYPFDFECERWQELWEELLRVVLFWADRGIRIFRVDNPHTKPLPFWEWLIARVRGLHPDAIFLAEAFTRPSVMQYLAKSGFSQSYSYFTWRNTKPELTAYFESLYGAELRDAMRPNLFVNTPDILPEYLQTGGRAAFQARAVLAATLGASYGVYGPPFELCVAEAVAGSEEYLHSEKYEIRRWDLERPDSLRELLTRLNEIRREHPALGHDASLRFVPVDNPAIIAYLRASPDRADLLIVAVNLDPHHAQAGWLELPLHELGLDPQPYQVDDLLGGARYLWHGPRNYVALDPTAAPAHVLRIRRRVRSEKDFDYYL